MKQLMPHENQAGYRYCVLCGTWKYKKEFAVNGLCHDGYHLLCLLHVDQAQSDRRQDTARHHLRQARVHPAMRLTGNG